LGVVHVYLAHHPNHYGFNQLSRVSCWRAVPPALASQPASTGHDEASLPDGPALLEMERHSRSEGSGLRVGDLIGRWRLDQLWGKGRSRPSSFSAALLRSLAARLEIAPGAPAENLRLGNAVNLGALELRCEGDGQLQGRRPLLVFWFERLQLRLGGMVLLERPLPRPQEKRLPFFELIAAERTGEGWLAARGRGGGLALWRREG
ncbi:MAG: hypothetical protein ACKOOH_09410, partial [Cyanobium sp.]